MIEIKSICKTFNPGTVNENKVLENLNLTLNEGDFVTIIGGNGAGKSTLINIISGAEEADSGMILLNDVDVSNLREHKRAPYFGHVFQDPMKGTATDMTILENLALAYGRGRRRSLFRWSIRPKDKQFYVEQLKTLGLGLENRLHQKVGLLSGGQRQALTLLMSTMNQKPTHRRIIKDYSTFVMGDKEKAKEEVIDVYKKGKNVYQMKKSNILIGHYEDWMTEVGEHFSRKSAIRFDIHLTKDQRIEKLKAEKDRHQDRLNVIRSEKHSFKEKKALIKEAYDEFDSKMRVYDLTKPVLLLDEHTAALDPKTAEKVLTITDRIVKENNLTTIMITHNMKDAIKYGNRLIMMSKGQIVVDISGKEKEQLTVEKLLSLFSSKSDEVLSDSAILGD